jgi:structural maintenance of chromosome 4
MKPKAANEHEEGLLEYLEDIIGTSKYKTPIEEALVEVDGLNEVMGEKKGRLGIVVRELNGLKVRPPRLNLRDKGETCRRLLNV